MPYSARIIDQPNNLPPFYLRNANPQPSALPANNSQYFLSQLLRTHSLEDLSEQVHLSTKTLCTIKEGMSPSRKSFNKLLVYYCHNVTKSQNSTVNTVKKFDEPQYGESKQYSVLLVEDNFIAQQHSRKLLESLQISVDMALSGEQALRKYSLGYDLIIVDIGLPGMNGIDVAKRIRAYEEKHGLPQTPIVALTAFSQDDIVKDCQSAGIQSILSKPASPAVFGRIIKDYLAHSSNEPTN